MRGYKIEFFNNKNEKLRETYERLPTDIGRWKRSKELSRKDNIRTRDIIEDTKGGLNKKVVKSYSYFEDGSKVVHTLLSSSNSKKKK